MIEARDVIAAGRKARHEINDAHEKNLARVAHAEETLQLAYDALADVGDVAYRIKTISTPDPEIHFWADPADPRGTQHRLLKIRRALARAGFRYIHHYTHLFEPQKSIALRTEDYSRHLYLVVVYPAASCQRVQVGTRSEPIYEIKCS